VRRPPPGNRRHSVLWRGPDRLGEIEPDTVHAAARAQLDLAGRVFDATAAR
jgi:hypothetical protein